VIPRRSLITAPAAALFAAPERIEITSVKAAPFQLRRAAAFGTNRFTSDFDPNRWRWFGPFSQLTGAILVQIRTKQGITGYGMGGGGGAAVYAIDNHIQDLLVGANALNVEMLWEQIFASTSFYGRKGVAVQALSGIDLALWDIAGKHAKKPVWQLLGGAVKEKAMAYYTGGNLELALKLGFKAFKMSMPLGPADGDGVKQKIVDMLTRARNTIGPDNLLMIDCLCRWNVPFTLEMADRLQGVKLHFIEEPVLPDDLSGYEKLCAEVKGTRIASGEHEYTHYGFDILLRHKAAHFLQPDLTWSGGLTAIRRVATNAASYSVPVFPHRGGSAFAMQLVISHPNCPMAESFMTGEGGDDLMRLCAAPFENGYYRAPEGAGMGVEFSEAVLRKHAPQLV